jgi:pilus assembly protein Flp/PilA
MSKLQQLIEDESGQDLMEYALVAALLALCAVASLKSIGSSISSFLNNVATTVTSST